MNARRPAQASTMPDRTPVALTRRQALWHLLTCTPSRNPRWSRSSLWNLVGLLVVAALGLSACATDEPEKPVLQILRGKVVPAPVEEIDVHVQSAASQQNFSVAGAIDARSTRSPLYFHWYHDWRSGEPLQPLCFSSEQSCTLYPCVERGASDANHTMLLVVADKPIGSDAESPYDFPDDVVWDAVQWQLRYIGSCP